MITKENLSKLNSLALRYFCTSLNESKQAKAYLLNRIDIPTIKQFYIGYAPKSGLIEYLNKYAVTTEDALTVGLIGLNTDDTAYEVFTKRIICPVINNKTIIGFGGRTLADHPTKYLNSKLSPLYNKSEILYLMDAAKKHIYKSEYAILVEGYFDVLSLYANGIKNVVASCGTAFKDAHALLLKRWTDSVFIIFDGDEPGKEATKKAKKVLKKQNIFGGTISLPDGFDPDSFIKKYGKKEFVRLLG